MRSFPLDPSETIEELVDDPDYVAPPPKPAAKKVRAVFFVVYLELIQICSCLRVHFAL